MFNPLPAIALLPLALLWFGLGTPSIIFESGEGVERDVAPIIPLLARWETVGARYRRPNDGSSGATYPTTTSPTTTGTALPPGCGTRC